MRKKKQIHYEPKVKVNCTFEQLLKIAIKAKPIERKKKRKRK